MEKSEYAYEYSEIFWIPYFQVSSEPASIWQNPFLRLIVPCGVQSTVRELYDSGKD